MVNKENSFLEFSVYTYIKKVQKYYQRNKNKLQNEARERYKDFSEEEKKGEKRPETDIKFF